MSNGRGLPFIQEIDDVFGRHGAGSFKFAALLAEEQLAIGIENGDGGDAATERNIVFPCDLLILISLTDIDVDHLK